MTNYAAYNAWANESFVNWLQAKPAELLTQETPSSYSSLVKTLNHILAVQEFWECVITETPLTSGRYLTQEFDAAEIFATMVTQSHAMAAHIATLSDAALAKEITLDYPWVKGTLPCYEIVQHCYNHSNYHRAQLSTIARSLGITDVPMSDYSFYNLVVKQGVMA